MNHLKALDLTSLGGARLLRGYSFAGFTGTMAAGLAAGSSVFVLRYPAAGEAEHFWIPWLHVHFVCIGAFSAPVTAGRRLTLARGSGADPSGGTALDVVSDPSDFAGGSVVPVGQVATTGALTVAGITYEAATRARMLVAHAGQSGQDFDLLWKLEGLMLEPGGLIGVRAPQAFDAGGTWQASFQGWGCELK